MIKKINGYEIKKTGRNYTVSIKENDGIGFKEFHSFKTLKAAIDFCKSF